MKKDTFEDLIKDEVLDSNEALEYLLNKFKMILLTSYSTGTINNLKRLFNIILKVKETQIIKCQELINRETLESNP